MPVAKKQSASSYKKQRASSYDVHPSLAMFQKTIAGLKQKTGRTLEEWIRFIGKEGPESEKDRREWLKAKHGMGTNYAWWIAERSVGKGDDGSPETYLKQAEEHMEEMYAGAKESLRPMFEELLALGRGLGKDV